MNKQEIQIRLTTHDNIKLHRADCMEIMAGYPDNYFDLAVVDPPYGIGIDGQKENKQSNRLAHEFKGWDDKPPSEEYFVELKRVSVNRVVWGANYMAPVLVPSSCWIIWDKMQEFSGATFEMAWTSFCSPAKAFRMSRVEAYTNQSKIHPTQKPVKLYAWIYANYAKPGQKILDTHLGSGSNAIAAHYAKMGEFVGCELDQDYYDAACERVYKETRQQELF